MTTPTKNVDKAKHAWVCTQVRGSQIKYDWTFENFELLSEKNGDYIVSSVFPANNVNEQWQLMLFPQGPARNNSGRISLFLSPILDGMVGIKVKVEFIIFRSKQVIDKRSMIPKYQNLGGRGFPYFTERSKILTASDSHETITIRCKIDVLGTTVTSFSNITDRKISFDSEVDQLTRHFRLLHENPQYTDFNVISGDKIFPVHKSVLASRSLVYAAMFANKELEENVKNEVKIDNIAPDVMKGLLEFIYTDDVLEIDALARGLLAAAEQYGLEGLKTLCEEALYKTLNKDNAAEILALADLYSAAQLKKYVIQYIVDYHSDVIESENFESTEISPALAKELIRALSHSKKNESES